MRASIHNNSLIAFLNSLGSQSKLQATASMRITVITCSLVFGILLSVNAQAPAGFNFQGVARDENGKIRANDLIKVEFSILSSIGGSILGYEAINVPTNSAGVFNHTIGTKSIDLKTISWGNSPHYLRIRINSLLTGDFVDLGTIQIMSVPYALYANEAGSLSGSGIILQKSALGSGDLAPTIGNGSRFLWYPRKGAFRAGSVTEGQWEDPQIGINSFGAGNDVVSSGEQSIALGNGLISKASSGTVLGSFNNDNDNPDGGDFDRIFQIGNGGSSASRSNALTVLRSGRVGIGKDATFPKHPLDVAGRIRVQHRNNETAGILFNSTANAEMGFVGMKNNNEIGLFIDGNWSFWVNAAGNGYLNGNIIQTSDLRLKHNIKPLTNSLSKLNYLDGKHYFWKDSTKSKEMQTGLIAQEVEKYFPELVSTDQKGFKSLNYIGLIPHLIESVKTLKAQTEELMALKQEVAAMRGLDTKLAALEARIAATPSPKSAGTSSK